MELILFLFLNSIDEDEDDTENHRTMETVGVIWHFKIFAWFQDLFATQFCLC